MTNPEVRNGTIPPEMISGQFRQFARLRTQNLTTAQQQILDGVAFEANWLEQAIATGSSRYAEFTIPVGFKMLLALRILNPQADRFLYRVYPQAAYTIGAAKTDDADNFARTRNLNQSSAFIGTHLIRRELGAIPDLAAHIVYESLWGSVNSGNRAVGETDSDDSFLLLNENQKFLLEMRNNSSTAAGSGQVKLQYAFIPSTEIPPPLV